MQFSDFFSFLIGLAAMMYVFFRRQKAEQEVREAEEKPLPQPLAQKRPRVPRQEVFTRDLLQDRGFHSHVESEQLLPLIDKEEVPRAIDARRLDSNLDVAAERKRPKKKPYKIKSKRDLVIDYEVFRSGKWM